MDSAACDIGAIRGGAQGGSQRGMSRLRAQHKLAGLAGAVTPQPQAVDQTRLAVMTNSITTLVATKIDTERITDDIIAIDPV